MAATVEIDEANGAGETLTHGITDSDMGSTDAANIDPVAYPITPGQHSYEKWQKVHVTAMGGSSAIDNLKIWRDAAPAANATHVSNIRTASYSGAYTYRTPITTASPICTDAIPTSEPGSANLGIAGSLSGQLTATGSSDYFIHQIQTNASATAGNTTNLNYQYDETA